jgi:membrane carboxypeptidase/penicillin-binding protein
MRDAVLAMRMLASTNTAVWITWAFCGPPGPVRRRWQPRRLHHHHAGGAQLLPFHRKDTDRKLYEVLLALKIESQLSKDQILEIYMNQIYLGQRAHGFAAASEIYFGKPLQDITVAEAAMLAGLPKAPSAYNPIANPKRATIRQRYIIDRMLENGFITAEQRDAALAQKLVYRPPTTSRCTASTWPNWPGR